MRSALALCVLCVVLAAACGARPRRGSQEASAKPSADGGRASAVVDAGGPRVCVFDAKDLAPCAEECDHGIAFACMTLAARVERGGEGVPRDQPRAVVLHERACELKEAAACVSAARMHATGAGVPPSRAKQVELLAVACALGDAFACSIPAKAYATGNGVVRDERRAHELWQRACAAGIESACTTIGEQPP